MQGIVIFRRYGNSGRAGDMNNDEKGCIGMYGYGYIAVPPSNEK